MNGEFKYEVAFSFLQDDEQLALEIADRIRDRVSVALFIYSERQNELAGTDGVEKFSCIFGEESRVVVILYREGWGQTKWTRVEETAIRTRGFNEGHEFALLVKLDSTNPPIWLPPTRLYLGFERYRIDGVASAIENRVQSSGGTVTSESVLDRAAIVARAIDFRSERRRWRDSTEAVDAAIEEVARLLAEFKRHTDDVNGHSPQLQMRYSSSGKKFCDLSITGKGFGVRWYNTYGNTLEQSGLILETWEQGRYFGQTVVRTPTTSINYNFDLDATRTTGWRVADDDRFFTTMQLAEYWVKRLIDEARES